MGFEEEFYCLVSIHSAAFNSQLICNFKDWAGNHDMKVRYVILSYPERHNVSVFDSVEEEEAQSIASANALSFQKKLGLADSDLMSWQEIGDRVGFEQKLKKVMESYRTNRSFRAHCLSQTFSNLQPRFQAIGIKKKSDARVQRAVFYLLEELAIKVGAFESGEFTGEILPKAEMPIVQKLYAGSYLPCNVSKQGFRVIYWNQQGMSEVEYSQEQ